MSVNNQDRSIKKCVLCHVRNAQLYSNFCEPCITERRAEALHYIGLPADPPDIHDQVSVYPTDTERD